MKNNTEHAGGDDLWSIVGRFLRPHWRLGVIGLFALFLASIGALALPWYLGTTIDVLYIEEQLDKFGTRLIVLFFIILVVGLSSAWRFYIMSVLGDRVGADLRKAIFANTMRCPIEFFEERQAGDLASRISADTVVIESLVGSKLSILIRNTVLLIGGIALLIYTNVKLLALTLLIIPILLGVLFYLGRRVARMSRAAQDATGRVLAKATESYETLSSIRIFGQEALEMGNFSDRVETAFGYYRGLRRWRAMMNAALTILTFSAIGIVIAKGSLDVIDGTMTGGEMARFVGLSI
ncbi:MAG: hypothetical protein LC637_04375, partial [Xanthomonadaceae bacterium]|nr:hypothetical protein [Xanthomonadaceae bacterium]